MGTKTIIHDPTRGWLLLTPDGQIEIDKEDWDAVVKSIPDDQLSFYGTSPIQDHHPYSVDAEFEVVEQFSTHPDYWVDKSVHWIERNIPGIEYRQIARLVKAKEEPVLIQTNTLVSKGLLHGQSKPTESQDELWREIVRDYTDPDGFLDVYLASKSFRIERI